MRRKQQGSMLIAVIAGIVIISALGAGIASIITTGVRSSTDHSLSIQAFYLAESGVEWAGYKLREEYKDEAEWEGYCEDDLENEFPVEVDDNKYFKILDSNAIIGVSSQNCTINVLGYVGSENPDKSLVSRRLQVEIAGDFIEGGGSSGDWEFDADNQPPANVSRTFSDEYYFAEDVTFAGTFSVYSDQTPGTQSGNLFIGDNVHVNGASQIAGSTSSQPITNVCIGNDFSVNGNLSLQNIENDVCIGDNADIRIDHFSDIGGNLVFGSNANVTINAEVGRDLYFGPNASVNLGNHADVGDIFFIDNSYNFNTQGNPDYGDVHPNTDASAFPDCDMCVIEDDESQNPASRWKER